MKKVAIETKLSMFNTIFLYLKNIYKDKSLKFGTHMCGLTHNQINHVLENTRIKQQEYNVNRDVCFVGNIGKSQTKIAITCILNH